MSEKTVFERIYDVVRRIPSGKVATYGQIAMLAGNPRWARAVGYALHANPEPGVIPCHRVLNRFGKTAPAFAFGGADRQAELLRAEGVEVSEDGFGIVRLLRLLGYGFLGDREPQRRRGGLVTGVEGRDRPFVTARFEP